MKTILGFDSWTGGAHNYERLVNAFKENGFDLTLLHIGSWGGDIGRKPKETIGSLKVIDVNHYSGKSLLNILDDIKPEAVVFLSNDVFAHRAFNRYCRLRNIPTLRLYHGLVEIQDTSTSRIYKTNIFSQFRFVLERMPKAFKYIWPLYIHSLYVSNGTIKDWLAFFSDIYKQAFGIYISEASDDCRTSTCAVYTKADVSHAVKKYKYEITDVHVVGNPDLIRFSLENGLLGSFCFKGIPPSNQVVYVDTGLIFAGMVFDNKNDFLEYLIRLKEVLYQLGLQLSVKLHPDHFRIDTPKLISDAGIQVIENDDFVTSLLHSRAAIVEPSSAALIPALLGVPVLMAAFDKLQNQKYGSILMNYPRSALVTDSEKILTMIGQIESRDISQVRAWIEENSGPLPADEMPERVAGVINRLIRKW